MPRFDESRLAVGAENVTRCNCESALCAYHAADHGCENKARKGKNLIQYIGPVCDNCYKTYPYEYRAENAPKQEPMECSICYDRGSKFVTADSEKFWDHQDEHRRRGEKPLP